MALPIAHVISGTCKDEAPIVRFDAGYTEMPVVLSSGSTSTRIQQDKTYTDHVDPSVRMDAQINIVTPLDDNVFTYESLDPSIGPVSDAGYITRVNNGNVRVNITANRHTTRRGVFPVSLFSGGTWTRCDGYIDETLGKNLNTQFDAVIAGKTDMRIFLSEPVQNENAPFVRNPDCWLNYPQLAAYSPWNYSSAQSGPPGSGVEHGLQTRCPACLISPRHAIFAHHMVDANASWPYGNVWRFVTMEGVTIERTLVDLINYNQYNGNGDAIDGNGKIIANDTDITIGIFDQDSPFFFKVLPKNWRIYFPNPMEAVVPIWQCNQWHQASVADAMMDAGVEHFTGTSQGIFYRKPADSQRRRLYNDMVSGDSCHPDGFIINGEMVLAGSHYTASATAHYGGESFISSRYDGINALMTTLSSRHAAPDYQLTDIDLSGLGVLTFP